MRRRRPIVKESDIQAVLDDVNVSLNQPTESNSMGPDGKLKWNIGTYQLGAAYGGYRIEKIMNNGGGIMPLSHYDTKRETLTRALKLRTSSFDFRER